jgi:hypothetical protein
MMAWACVPDAASKSGASEIQKIERCLREVSRHGAYQPNELPAIFTRDVSAVKINVRDNIEE